MNASKPFLLDTNVFIEAKNSYYAFSFCPGFWQCLLNEHRRKNVFSIDLVRQELFVGKDELKTWVESSVPPSFFHESGDMEVMALYQDIMAWVSANPQFLDYAKADFASGADGWLIAYASVKGFVVVTREELAPAARNRVPMPNVCEQFGVEYQDTFYMLRTLKVQLYCRGAK